MKREIRNFVKDYPQKFSDLLKWYAPGFLWMLSSVGSGSVLFTPRVGSRYGYDLAWAAVIIIFIQWTAIKEAGRYSVVTGNTLMEGFRKIPGPKNWAIWVIFLPQLVAAVVTIGGIAALSGSALMIAFPGSQLFYSVLLILISIVLVIWGKYKGVEKVSSFLAGILVVIAVIASVMVFPGISKIVGSLVPKIPDNLDLFFVIPWLGFILAGAVGIIWFSYWTAEKGFGGNVDKNEREEISLEEKIKRLKNWNKIMTTTATIGVVSGGIVILSFLILGAEVLKPEGIMPEGIKVAEDLTKLLSKIWGPAGYWIILLGIFIALFGTILADQDGWGRFFADATMILASKKISNKFEISDKIPVKKAENFLNNKESLKNFYAVTFTAVLPLIIFLIVRNPVDILSAAGIIAAIHTPVVIFLILFVNKKLLIEELRPGKFITFIMIFSGIFFSVIGIVYLLDLTGIKL